MEKNVRRQEKPMGALTGADDGEFDERLVR
jgi:hypothetical protein